MKIFDISRSLSEDILVYPGDIHPKFHQEDRGNYLISDLHMSTHSGTHIDAPVHYLKTGVTIDTVPLSQLIGKCRVLDVSGAGNNITADHLNSRLDGVSRFLLKTTYSAIDRFEEIYPCLAPDAAHMIAALGMKCVGIDTPSIESYNGDGTVHRKLLSCNCIIIELLDLSYIEEGDYDMVALPLRLKGLDGSPARVVLIERDGD
ncbi:MAG: cyclase family protein [Methanoregula sp.]